MCTNNLYIATCNRHHNGRRKDFYFKAFNVNVLLVYNRSVGTNYVTTCLLVTVHGHVEALFGSDS